VSGVNASESPAISMRLRSGEFPGQGVQ